MMVFTSSGVVLLVERKPKVARERRKMEGD